MKIHRQVLLFEPRGKRRRHYASILESAGHQVIVCENAEEIAETYAKHLPDLTLLSMDPRTVSVVEKFLNQVRGWTEKDFNPIAIIASSLELQRFTKKNWIRSLPCIERVYAASRVKREIQNLLRELKEKNLVFQDDVPEIMVTLDATVVSVNEGGMLIEAPARLSPNSIISLESSRFSQYSLEECIFQKSERPSTLSAGNQYFNDISIVGLQNKMALKIRREKLGLI